MNMYLWVPLLGGSSKGRGSESSGAEGKEGSVGEGQCELEQRLGLVCERREGKERVKHYRMRLGR